MLETFQAALQFAKLRLAGTVADWPEVCRKTKSCA